MDLRELAPAGITLVVTAIVLGLGADVLTDVAAGQTGTAKDATQNGTQGLGELAKWLPTIALVVAAAVIIGIVVSYFAFK